jgi:hypothetical protein
MYQNDKDENNLNNNSMTLNSRIKERGINAIIVLVVFFIMSIYSCVAQEQQLDPNFPRNPVKTAGNVINVAREVNLEAKAIPMRTSINSPFAELKPSFSPKGDKLYFSRVAHPNNTNGEADQEDVWYANYDTLTSDWSEPIRMSGHLNNRGPNFIQNVSVTGDTLILGNQYLKKGKMKDGVSYSVNINGEWSFPKPITILNDYNMSQHGNHFVSLKSGVIISAVERSESKGHRDLYVSFWNGKYATEPVNMGGVINSALEESSPYLACDNKTLYFASKGHNGYGGYDIFRTTRLDDSWTNWSVPVNLGPAVNGEMDEEFFSITHCGRYAIFTKKMGIHNEDLYKISVEDLFNNNTTTDPRVTSSFNKRIKKERHTLNTL